MFAALLRDLDRLGLGTYVWVLVLRDEVSAEVVMCSEVGIFMLLC